MATRGWAMPLRAVRRAMARSPSTAASGTAEDAARAGPWQADPPRASSIDIPDGDPLVAHLASATGAIDIEALELDSPALRELNAAGVKLVVPLISQGEL